MDLKISTQDNKVVVNVVGSIDERGAEELKRHILGLDVSKTKDIVFDFSGVTFIGSAGIGKLLLFYRNVAGLGGQITIENMSKDIFTMFKVVKLDKIFNINPAK
ncbi:MAG: STAS domain-containing protein [Desulfarculales bacterium]|jgi:anti-anti-sigma factor|nr:STAS domain-containing protein [Desulfarculales bacterium]